MSTPSRLSRSARNRLARNNRGTVPTGTVQPRTVQNSPHDPAHSQTGIRTVGYLGRNPTRVHYSGSSTDGYRSEWARDGYDFWTDARWDQTVSTSGIRSL